MDSKEETNTHMDTERSKNRRRMMKQHKSVTDARREVLGAKITNTHSIYSELGRFDLKERITGGERGNCGREYENGRMKVKVKVAQNCDTRTEYAEAIT